MILDHLRAKHGDARGTLVMGVTGGMLLALWTLWFLSARLSVWEISRTARVEVVSAMHPVEVPLAGKVVRSHLQLGQLVNRGDILVELDTERPQGELAVERATLGGLEARLAAITDLAAEAKQTMAAETTVATTSRQEAQARQRAEAALTALKRNESAQIAALRRGSFASEVDLLRAQAEADSSLASSEALKSSVERLGGEQKVRRSERRTRLAELQLQRAELESQRLLGQARIRLLEQEINRHFIRAPVRGRVGDVMEVHPGSVLEEGRRIATVVPEGTLRMIAYFDPGGAIGRIRPGEPGRVRLNGFPWTRFGTIPAQVSSVGNDPLNGLVRVELTLQTSASTIPVQHGLTGLVEVEVERVSPATLVLDTAGRLLQPLDDAHAAPTSAPP